MVRESEYNWHLFFTPLVKDPHQRVEEKGKEDNGRRGLKEPLRRKEIYVGYTKPTKTRER